MKPQYDLAGRAALITGGGVGIGRAIAEALAAAGASVAIHCHRSRDEADTLASQINGSGGRAFVVAADLGDPAQAASVVDRAVAELGRLDILVNNAGTVVARARIEDCSLDLWQQAIAVNLTAAFIVTQRAIPHLRASGKGAIINNLSLSVQTGGANGAGAYAAAKGGLQVLTRTLARELAPLIRTNAIMPGVIETRHHEQFSSPERMAEYRAQTPLARNGTAQEVAAAVLFLASEASSFIDGAVIDVNGGRFLR
jgi:3-oxoacyl-[acyl-carrier protein] reductase